jgi:hypothetical protein
MSERDKQNKFLKDLIGADDSEHCRELRAKITKAERDERCVRSALFLVTVIALLSAAGLAYSAVLVPEFFQNTKPLVVKVFSVLVLTCVIALLGFMGFWWWHRGVCNRLYHECRNWVRSLHQSDSQITNPEPDVQKQGVPLYPLVTPQPDEAQIVTFPRAASGS